MFVSPRLAPAMAVALAVFAAAGSAHASPATGIAGLWRVGINFVNCSTGAPAGPAFTSLLSFGADGTESEATNNPALQPGQRSTGYGVWHHPAPGKYTMDTFALILFATDGPPPLKAGVQKIHQSIALSGDSWTSTATVKFYDATGKLYRAGCAAAAATRLN